MQTSDAIKAIKERLNIADIIRRYVDLKQNGARLVAPCPFHQETKPSFSVDPEKGFFYCFGCQAKGDIFEFYSRINGLDFRSTLEQLAGEAGIIIDQYDNPQYALKKKEESNAKQLMLAMHADAARFFRRQLDKSGADECREYIKKREIAPEIVESFELGWAPREWHELEQFLIKQGYDIKLAQECGLLGLSSSGKAYDRFRGRLIFPIKNLSNQIIAFGGRIIAQEEEAKYINSQETPIYKKKEHLFGLVQARRGITSKGSLILTEGYIDVLSLHQFGYDNSVGVLGTALTEEQIRRIGGFTSNILLLFDGDRAGRKAALRSSEMLLSKGFSCNVALLPEGEDIDSLLKGQGKRVFEDIMSQARPALNFCVDVMHNLAPKELVDWAKNFLTSITVPGLFSRFASELSHHLGIDEKFLRSEACLSPSKYGETDLQNSKLCKLRNTRDTQILIYAVRYPDRLGDLRDLGADLTLSSTEAKEFWDLLEQWGADEVIYHMTESQKNFWHEKRMPPAPPLTTGDYELTCLQKELEAFYKSSQLASLSAVLAQSGKIDNFDTELEYIRALQETLEKNNEQS